jgi:hypothetical protein
MNGRDEVGGCAADGSAVGSQEQILDMSGACTQMAERRSTDRRGVLDEDVFSFQASKAGTVFVSWRGRRVTALRGAEGRRFLDRVAALDRKGAQLLMARVTGNFKRGNERAT